MTAKVLHLHHDDNVVVALDPIDQGQYLPQYDVHTLNPIESGHKIALGDMKAGDHVVKLGVVIGIAKADIQKGEHVHRHNLKMPEVAITHVGGGQRERDLPHNQFKGRTFKGYRREDGRVGTRNFIGILPVVNCSATVTRMIADHFRHLDQDKYPNVDGVFALTHQHGCSVAAFPEGYDLMQRTLAGYVRHPNFGGMVVIGLGCEDNPVGALMKEHDLSETATRKIFEIQSEGGTKSTVQAGIEAVEKLLEGINQDEREEVSISELTLALQCGGSDGFSAIGANPALGVASDLLAAAGGSSILSETPEIFGVHHLLKARAVNSSVALEVDQLIDWWLDHAKRWDGSLDDNPSEGNAEGGLTTIIEKALGSASKGGHGPLMDVRRYGQPLREKGLTFMDSPGNDWVSVTGQVATGANIVAFTTGRGSVFGCRPAPSVKLATNSRLYSRMEDDMDINCGPVVEGEISLVEKGCEILEMLIETASGKLTKSEELGFGQEEMSPWVISGTV